MSFPCAARTAAFAAGFGCTPVPLKHLAPFFTAASSAAVRSFATAGSQAFGAAPENPERIIAPSGREDEIGIAERELRAMQIELSSLLNQKSHLAALGLAVSKVRHPVS